MTSVEAAQQLAGTWSDPCMIEASNPPREIANAEPVVRTAFAASLHQRCSHALGEAFTAAVAGGDAAAIDRAIEAIVRHATPPGRSEPDEVAEVDTACRNALLLRRARTAFTRAAEAATAQPPRWSEARTALGQVPQLPTDLTALVGDADLAARIRATEHDAPGTEARSEALRAGRYEDVCADLATEGFAADICAWIVQAMRGAASGPLSSAALERFLRSQRVRRVSGTIVGWYDEDRNEYETRISGHIVILSASETRFETTGRFTLWAQPAGTSDEELVSGRELSVPIYREWPLFELFRAAIAARGEARAQAARELLEEVIRAWSSDYCYTEDGELACWVDPAIAEAASASITVPTDGTRTAWCTQACAAYRACRDNYWGGGPCTSDLTPECRACRREGVVP